MKTKPKLIMKTYDYSDSNKNNSTLMNSIDQSIISQIVNDQIKDMNYKNISSKYQSSQFINSFNTDTKKFDLNLNLNQQTIKVKAPNIIVNEILLSLLGHNNYKDDKDALKRKENDIVFQEEILKLSIERNKLIKQLDDIIQFNSKKIRLYNKMQFEHKELTKTKQKYTQIVVDNEAIIQSLNNELSAYYKQKKKTAKTIR